MEAIWFKSGHHRGGLTGEMPVVVCLSLCGRYAADGLEQAMVVEPGNPFERCQLHSLFRLQWSAAMDQFGPVEPVDRLGQGVVIAAEAIRFEAAQFKALKARLLRRGRAAVKAVAEPYTVQTQRPQSKKHLALRYAKCISCLLNFGGP